MKMFDDAEGQDPAEGTEGAEVENSPQENENTQDVEVEHEGGYNPVFEPIRQTLGLQFESILPDLKQIEKGFNSGITNANSKYAPWKTFDEQGITPEQINQGFGMLKQLNDEPEKIYTALHDFLKENGRLPETQAEVNQVVEDAEDDLLTDSDKKLAELQKQVEDQQAFFQQQQEQFQQQQLNEKAEQEVAKEFDDFEKAHPDLSDEDRQAIYERHFLYAASGPQNVRPLEQVAKEYLDFVDRIRSAPRPNDSAPRLFGAGGGVPAGQRKKPEELSREESQNYLAALLEQGKN